MYPRRVPVEPQVGTGRITAMCISSSFVPSLMDGGEVGTTDGWNLEQTCHIGGGSVGMWWLCFFFLSLSF